MFNTFVPFKDDFSMEILKINCHPSLEGRQPTEILNGNIGQAAQLL